MTIFIVIPTKPFGEGKSRLASVLDRETREDLNRSLFRHTLQCALKVQEPDRIVVVSRSAEAVDSARIQRAHGLLEAGVDLNAAIAQATAYARGAGATGILSLSSDLPLLTKDDVVAMLVSPPRGVLLAPDRAGTGTNALTVVEMDDFAWHFGPNSFQRHLAEARRVGAVVQTIASEGLAFDLDTPEDFHDWKRKGIQSKTSSGWHFV